MLYTILIILLASIALIGLWLIAKYNALIRLKNLIDESWSGIEVQLKRRYDLIPNLVATVKGYSTHEKTVFEDVTRLRGMAMQAHTVTEKSETETQLTNALKTLFAVAESYPELKANENFLSLQKELSNIEEQIQLSRRYYNGVVRTYNTMIMSFPDNIVAGLFNFNKASFFELKSEIERETPKVSF